MEPYEIEDTDDWLGSPTPLETCRHSLHIYENEIQELTLQLRQAREKIYKLVEMHAGVAQERDGLRSELQKNRVALDEVSRRAAELETKTNWELMASNKHITELTTQIRILKGESPYADPFPHQRDNSRT
jgi:chromosome segregation ATPase